MLRNHCCVQGNLALAMAPEPAPCFSVYSGGSRQTPAAVPSRASSVARGALCSLVILAVLIACYAVFSGHAEAHEQAIASIEYVEIEVQPGDSLWRIAEKHAVPNISTAEMVRLIIAENDLSGGTIHPGQTLFVALSPAEGRS